MFGTRTIKHGRRKIEAQPPARGAERCEQIALPAADFQNPLSGCDQEAINFRETMMVKAAPAAPRIALARYRVPVGDTCLLVELPGKV